jgi:hypothetical protein
MKKLILTVLISLFLVMPVMAANCGDGVGSCACGDTLTASYTFTGNLDCPTDTPALTIGADSLTLNLGGYRLSGEDTLGSWTATGANNEYWIEDPTGGVTIMMRDGIPVDQNDDDSENGDGGDLEKGHWTLDTTPNPDRIHYRLLDTESDMSGSTWTVGYGQLIDLNQKDGFTITNGTLRSGTVAIYDDYNGADPATNVIIGPDITFNYLSTTAIWIEAGGTVVIYNNDFEYNRMSLLSGSADGTPAATEAITSLSVYGNTFNRNRWNWDETFGGGHDIDLVPFTDNFQFYDNTISNYAYFGGKEHSDTMASGVAFSIDGAQNGTIRNNTFVDNYVGIIAAGCDANANRNGSGNIIYNNTFENNMRGDWAAASAKWTIMMGIKVSTKDACGNIDLSFLIGNNSFLGNNNSDLKNGNPLGASCVFFSGTATSDISGITLINNIFSENTSVHDLRVQTENGDVAFDDGDHNIYYRASGDYIAIGNNAAPDEYPDTNNFAAFQATAYGDANDLNVNPNFISDFRIGISSGAVDGGELQSYMLAGWYDYDGTERLCGDAPDIGADEFCRNSGFPPFIFDMGSSMTLAWYVEPGNNVYGTAVYGTNTYGE